MKNAFVSIIIPTYRDWERLTLCIAALKKQTFPKDSFEVIIVNNDSDGVMPDGFSIPHGYQIISEKKSGSYAARNAGLRLAKGEIIGFTDSDCIPEPDWIENAFAYFKASKTCIRIAGKISIFYKSSKPSIAELYNVLYSFPQKNHVDETGTSVTGNLFTYKHVFDSVGLFNETLLSLGDLEWGRRASKAGFKIDYVDNVIVKHPARSFKELVIKEKRVGGGIGMRERGKKTISFLNILNEYRPRWAEFKFMYKNGLGLSLIEKVKVLALRHYLLGVRANEKFKVHSGKMPNRA